VVAPSIYLRVRKHEQLFMIVVECLVESWFTQGEFYPGPSACVRFTPVA